MKISGFLLLLIVTVLMFTLAACEAEAPAPAVAPEPVAASAPVEPAPADEAEDEVEEPEETEALVADVDEYFPGIIAIVTNTIDQNEEEFRSAEALVNRFGADRVIHRTWPVYFAAEPEMMVTILSEIASNLDVGAIVINQGVVNTNAAIDVVRELRGDDIFIAVANPHEDPRDVYARVDLALDVNNPAIGEIFVQQAAAMGAEVIAHYSFPRHMAMPALATRRDNMAAAAEAVGIHFVDLPSPDPMEEGGMAASQLFISQDVGRQVEELGENTVFFSTNCGQQIPLLQQVLEYGAMYVQPCCPSPFHAFPAALGLAAGDSEAMELFTIEEIIEVTSQAIAEAGLTGRFSNWGVPASMANTEIAFMYAVEWLNENVTREVGVIEVDVLTRLFADYIERMTGTRLYPEFTPLQIGDDTFSIIQVYLMPYLMY